MVTAQVKKIIKAALEEDIGAKDITTSLSLPSSIKGEGVIVAKEKGLLCGIKVAEEVFKTLSKEIVFRPLKKDGDHLDKNEKVAGVKGNIGTILTAERVALNFLSRLSGISTATAKFVNRVKPANTKILDTRKTTPTLRALEKYAVGVGGGRNHRLNLEKGIIVKDNHLRAGNFLADGELNEVKFQKLIKHLRSESSLKIEIEVENLTEFKSVVKYKPDIVMLDNFSLNTLRKAVALRNKYFPKVLIEASGGINLANIKAIADCGVDFISVGSITHSAQIVDFSLEIL
ncbi:MAG: carboxylating nicotinate-nucleotide diphosphorylase [Candidatus Omnitrophota bacterium]|nr:MAG: carboxylating nicotinate-nucleotide diphosphorylase [Candidatus Omnitrophota bacterium]